MDRRKFLAAAGAIALTGCQTVRREEVHETPRGRNGVPFRLGVAGVTFSRFKLEAALAELKRFGVHDFCAKDFHFPLDAKPAALRDLVARAAESGVRIYAAGPIEMSSADEAKRAFDYAATLGVPTVVGVPAEPFVRPDGTQGLRSSRRMCEVCSRLADEYRIDFAIHNHGNNPKTGNPDLYPTAVATDALIRDLSLRMGHCLDIAYTHADGFDPAEILRRFAPRIFDVHLRNVAVGDNGSSGASAEDGVIDYVRVFRALADIGYDRVCGLELGNAFKEPSAVNPGADPSWVPRSLGYFRGLMDALG